MSSLVRWVGYVGTLGGMVLAILFYLLGQKFTLFTGAVLDRVFGWVGQKAGEYEVAQAIAANVATATSQRQVQLHWTETYQLWMVGLFVVGVICLEIARRMARAVALRQQTESGHAASG